MWRSGLSPKLRNAGQAVITTTAIALNAAGHAGAILYVDDDAPPPPKGTGESWKSPLRYLQDALAFASKPNSGVTEIRIGQGTYKADQGANQTPGDNNATFVVSNLALRGGYAGVQRDNPDAQDFELYLTILNGDLLENDGPPGSFDGYQDNTRRIVSIIQDANSSSHLEGLQLRSAAGFPTDGSMPPEIIGGGGVQCLEGHLIVTQCEFSANQAVWGGGGYVAGSNSQFRHCQFVHNRCAGSASAAGGGLYGGHVTDCQFIANDGFQAGSAGAAVGSHFERCYFQDNVTGGHGGAVWSGGEVIDCEFVNNHASEEGGAVYGFPHIVRCTFQHNSANSGGAVRGIATIRDSRFIDNISTGYGGAGFWGGGAIINCEFTANKALNSSAGGAAGACKPTTGLQLCGPAEFINCIFNANYSFSLGGGAWIESTQTATFTNCTFVNNESEKDPGAGISTNNGIAPPGFAIVRNCIITGNSPGQLYGPMDVQYSLVQGGWPGEGNIDVNPGLLDPLGRDGIAGTDDDNLRLSAGSPCIDAGNNTALPPDTFDVDGDGITIELLPIDFDGNPRRVNDPNTPNTGHPRGPGAIVDMGAFEFGDFKPVFADISGNGVVDVDDLLMVINAWGACETFNEECPGDLDGNGAVGVGDLDLVIASWTD